MVLAYKRLRNLSAREMIQALMRDGFTLDRQSGSHQHYLHADRRRVTVTLHHPSDTFDIKTLKTMIRDQARWTVDDLRRLGLLR